MTDTITPTAQQSTVIYVIGKSGRGKSTAIRSLDPEYTYIINCVGKLLPFPKGRQYTPNKNLLVEQNALKIIAAMKKVSSAGFKNLVIDDIQYVMAGEFMLKALERGYDKFSIMARNMWNILITATNLAPDMKVYIMAHEEDTGSERRFKTLGKLLDEKITPEGLAPIVLFADMEPQDKGTKLYYLSTQTDGVTSAKSPMDMFPDRIPNDLKLVSDRIDEYYAGVELKDSKLDFNLV